MECGEVVEYDLCGGGGGIGGSQIGTHGGVAVELGFASRCAGEYGSQFALYVVGVALVEQHFGNDGGSGDEVG